MNRNLFNLLLVLSFLSIFLNRVNNVRAQASQDYFREISSPNFRDLLPADADGGQLSGSMICKNQTNYFEFKWDPGPITNPAVNVIIAIGWYDNIHSWIWRREGRYQHVDSPSPSFGFWVESGNLREEITGSGPIYIPINNPLGTFEYVVHAKYKNEAGQEYSRASNVYKPKIDINDYKRCSGLSDASLVDNAIQLEGQTGGLDKYIRSSCEVTADTINCINYGKTVCPSDIVKAVGRGSTGFGAIGKSIGSCIYKQYPPLEPKDYCPKQTDNNSCLFYSNCKYFDESICGINKCVPKNTPVKDVCLSDSINMRVINNNDRYSLFKNIIRNSCFQGDNILTVDEDCVQTLRDSCISKKEDEVPLAGIPDCLYKNIPSIYITQLEAELPQLGPRPPVRNQTPAAGAPAQAQVPAQAPPSQVLAKTYALAQVNEASHTQEFSDISTLRIAGLIYTNSEKPSESCASISPTITITKVGDQSSTDVKKEIYKETGVQAKNCYSHELPPNTIKEFGTYLVKVDFTPTAGQPYLGSSAEVTFIYKQKPAVNTKTTITLEDVPRENGKFITTLSQLKQNGLKYTACTTPTGPGADKISHISSSIRLDSLVWSSEFLPGSTQINNCEAKTIDYQEIVSAFSQPIEDITSIVITASFPGENRNNYQQSSETVSVFIKNESGIISKVDPVENEPVPPIVELSYTPNQISANQPTTFQAQSNQIIIDPKFVLIGLSSDSEPLRLSGVRMNICQQTGENCLYSATITPRGGLSKIEFYDGDELIKYLIPINAPTNTGPGTNVTPANPAGNQTGAGGQPTGNTDNRQPAGDTTANQGGQNQVPAVVTPQRKITHVYLQIPAGEVELLENNGQVDLQVPVGETVMNIKIVYDVPDQYGSNTHIKPFKIIYEPPPPPLVCEPGKFERRCQEPSKCRYLVKQCSADGSGYGEQVVEENCLIANEVPTSDEFPQGCNTKETLPQPSNDKPEHGQLIYNDAACLQDNNDGTSHMYWLRQYEDGSEEKSDPNEICACPENQTLSQGSCVAECREQEREEEWGGGKIRYVYCNGDEEWYCRNGGDPDDDCQETACWQSADPGNREGSNEVCGQNHEGASRCDQYNTGPWGDGCVY